MWIRCFEDGRQKLINTDNVTCVEEFIESGKVYTIVHTAGGSFNVDETVDEIKDIVWKRQEADDEALFAKLRMLNQIVTKLKNIQTVIGRIGG